MIEKLCVTKAAVLRLRRCPRETKVVPVGQVSRGFATQLLTATYLARGYPSRGGVSAGHRTGDDSLAVCEAACFVRPCRPTTERPRQ